VSRFIAGDSVRKISREENRDRETINRILRSNQVQLYIEELRASYIGLGLDAINAVRKRLKSGKDGRLAVGFSKTSARFHRQENGTCCCPVIRVQGISLWIS
jgi:hypothetical protein